ncbi:hypothetical protein RND81_05G142600 [Saponaria officinalis]|uniref:DEUBAD domain-containing protein n=1 Tax=Saponaria officinalis TaxID=3572 RepID=A0AAW1KY54_SAPOF
MIWCFVVYDVFILLGNSRNSLALFLRFTMAADQRKRRLNSTTAPYGCGIQEQYRAKKRDLRSLQYEFNHNNHVSLKWDDNAKVVVAKEDQIGLSSRHLAQFGLVSSAKLADVVVVPKEVFQLNDLTEVLTFENWQSLITEKDRIFLTQFLPRGFEPDEIVQALLGCENFHFGNPFLKWSSSLCSGGLHPDAIVQSEKSFKADKKAYYSELQQYHDTMVGSLQKLKERCGNSEDPESEILKITSRSKDNAEKNVLPDSNGFSSQNLEANAAYESTSSIPEDKSYYSDNQKLSVIRDAEIQRRIRNQEIMKDKQEKSSSSPNGVKGIPKLKKAEKLPKGSIASNDGTKYMSYVMISKKQHEELVMSMGQSCPVIQPKNINRLLGNLDNYNVKPYAMFGEEEQKRIHEHWRNMVKIDIPAALEKWKSGQLERLKIMGRLCQELEVKLGLLTEDQNEKSVNPFDEVMADAQDCEGTSKNHDDNKPVTQGSVSVSDSDQPTHCSSENETSEENLPLNINQEFDPSSVQNPSNVDKEVFDPPSIENPSLQNPSLNINTEFDPSSSGNQSLSSSTPNMNEEFGSSPIENKLASGNPLLDDNQEFNPMDLNAENDEASSERSDTCSPPEQSASQTSDVSLGVPHTETHGSASPDETVQMPVSSVNSIWSSVGFPQSFGPAHPTTPFASSSEPSQPTVGHLQLVPEQAADCSMVSGSVSHCSMVSGSVSHCSMVPGSVGQISNQIDHTRTEFIRDLGCHRSLSVNPVTFNELQPIPRTETNIEPCNRQPTHLIDLDPDLPGGPTKDLLNRHTDHMSFINPYANRETNELQLQSLIQRDRFHQEQKKIGSVFYQSNVVLDPNQFQTHIREQLQPPFAVDHRQRAQSELFMSQNIPESIYSDNNRYSIPNQEHFPTLNPRNWGNYRMSTPMQSQLASVGMNHSWLSNDHRPHSGWSTPESTAFSTANLGSVGGDQSLYSVLSQCNSLQPRPHYIPVSLAEQMLPSTSYVQDMAAAGIPMTSNPLPQTVSPFDYLSGSETTTALKNPVMGWMSLGHQSSSLHDPSGKPFMKPWNP